MDLLSMLMGSMTQDSSVSNIAGKTGASNDQIKKLIKFGLPILLAYLTKNASKKEGAHSLLGALTQHQSSKPVADQLAESDEEDGAKILQHIFGKDKDTAVAEVAKESGMDTSQAMQALSVLAPVLLSGLSSATGSAKPAASKPAVDLSDGIGLDDIMGIVGAASGSSKKQSAFDGSDLLNLLGAFM
jgi:hypothetical protein